MRIFEKMSGAVVCRGFTRYWSCVSGKQNKLFSGYSLLTLAFCQRQWPPCPADDRHPAGPSAQAATFYRGSGNLVNAGECRKQYINALRAADLNDYEPLLAFVRS